MCGISVVLKKTKNNDNFANRLVKMTNAIKHRGPDDEGYLLITRNNETLCLGGNDTKNFQNGDPIDYLPVSKIQKIMIRIMINTIQFA
jgi:hypothetical protein